MSKGVHANRLYSKDRDRKVLVLLDGSKESAFLFRQVEDAMKQKNFKRLILEPCFVFLLSSTDIAEIRLVEERMHILRQALPGTYFIVHLSAIFGHIELTDDNSCQGLQYLSKLEEFLSAFRTVVSREEAMRILKIRVLQKLSRITKVSKVDVKYFFHFLEIVTHFFVGGSISKMTDVVEKTLTGTTFVRPLRDVTSAEIAVALRLENVENYVLLPELKSGLSPNLHFCEASKKRSLQEMSSAFLAHFIKEGFESTIPTVLGISNKVHSPVEESCCSICDYPTSASPSLLIMIVETNHFML
ncbi:unnamed protein product [Strongylus vulgaris]|uniref:Cytoplasmic tRNA 2-thiolation protein 2 n=1 Tax=Strongylus vulgaris TaxID=40348 RepID=A0A3P7IPD6_STRVU|nr:unnamed protein product [Strongylus vulgaris]